MADEQKKEWHIDVSDVKKMKPILEWNRAVTSGNSDVLLRIMSTRVKSWPYAFDPAEPESYEELEPEQWQETTQRVGAAFNSVFQRTNGKRK